jgi:hypothetical protein
MEDIRGPIDNAEQCAPELLPLVWWSKVEPVFRQVREASVLYYTPSSNVSIDECMIRCFGRSSHTYKMPDKPIPQGYKLFALADHGYIWKFLPASRTKGLIETARDPGLTLTGSMVLQLAEELPKEENTYSIYLDNYFTSLPLFEKLRSRHIGACGTTRPHAAGVDYPIIMKKLKELHSHVPYNTICAVPVGSVLCFAWQDNNIVLGLSTIHTVNQPSDLIQRMRRRPKKTSTNGAIVRPVFGDAPRKEISIPRFIDDYNHFMGGVDIANQHRAAYETHLRAWRSWWPLWAWAIDVAIVNCFKMQSVLYKQHNLPKPEHCQFRQVLYKRLFESHKAIVTASRKRKLTPDLPPCRLNKDVPHRLYRDVFTTCVWCRHSVKRSKGDNGRFNRATSTQWWCTACQKPLCRPDLGRSCWTEFHSIAEDDVMARFS